MGFEAKIQQKINAYRQSNPKVKLSDEQILSILVKNGDVVLTDDQKRSLFANNSKHNDNIGLKLEKTAQKPNPEKTIYLQSGRKVVYSRLSNGKTVMKYFGADGTRINPDYFKKVEGQISISADGNSYTVTKNGKKQTLKAKNPTQGAVDQNIAKLNNQEKALNKAKNEQGWIGKGWDLLKNTTGIGDSSDKVQQQINAEKKLLNQIKTGKVSKKDFKEVTGLDYTKENLEKFKRGELSQAEEKINGYKEGQDMAADVAGDMVSGIAAVAIYTAAVAAAPVTGGASIAVGVGLATASGAAIKIGVKALDTVGTNKKYTFEDMKHDAATGGFSGALAPVTAGLGGAVGKTIATKFGIQAVKSVGKEVAEEAAKGGLKSTLKTALTNPAGYEYAGGTLLKRGSAMAAEMATDGALSGAVDGGFRAGLDSDWDTETMLDGAIEGGIGGAIMSPVVGGGMKAAGKGMQKVFGKDNVKIDADGNKVADEVPGKIESETPKVEKDVDTEPASSKSITQEEQDISGNKNINPETPIQVQQRLIKELENAKSREDFSRITQEMKNLPKTEEYKAVRERLGGEHLQRYNEWKANQSESTRAIKNMADDENEFFFENENILESCKLQDGTVSELLLNEAKFLKDKLSFFSFITLDTLKTKDGSVDTLAIQKLHELIDKNIDAHQALNIIELSKNNEGLLDNKLFQAVTSLKQFDNMESLITYSKNKNGEIEDITLKKIKDMQDNGLSNYQMATLIRLAQDDNCNINYKLIDDMYDLLKEFNIETCDLRNIKTSCSEENRAEFINIIKTLLNKNAENINQIYKICDVIKSDSIALEKQKLEQISNAIKDDFCDISLLRVDENGILDVAKLKLDIQLMKNGTDASTLSIIDYHLESVDVEKRNQIKQNLCKLDNILGVRDKFLNYINIFTDMNNAPYIDSLLSALEKGADVDVVLNMFNKNHYNSTCFLGLPKEKADNFKRILLDAINKDPEKAALISEIFTRYIPNADVPDNFVKLCLNNPSNAGKINALCCIDAYRNQISNSRVDALYMLTNSNVSFDDSIKLVENMFVDTARLKLDENALAKLSELVKQGKLDTELASYLRYCRMNVPESVKVIDKLVKLKAENKLPEYPYQINSSLYNTKGELISNFEEVLDFYCNNYKSYDVFDSLEDLNFVIDRFKHDKKQVNVSDLQTIVDLKLKCGMTSDEIATMLKKRNQDVESFIHLIQKVDLTEEKTNEIKKLCQDYSRIGYSGKLSFDDFKKEEINYLLEIERKILDSNKELCLNTGFFDNLIKGTSEDVRNNIISVYIDKCINNKDISYIYLENIAPIINLAKTNPEVVQRIKPYLEKCNVESLNNISVHNIAAAIERNCSDEALKFLFTKIESGELIAKYTSIAKKVSEQPELISVINKVMELNPKIRYYDIGTLCENKCFDVNNKDYNAIKELLTTTDEYGNVRFNFEDFYRNILGFWKTDLEDNIPIENIRQLATMKNEDGTFAFDNYLIRKLIQDDPYEIELLRTNPPPTKQLDSYTLYNRTFESMKDEFKKYGCSSFKEFESIVPTLTGKDRAEAGKLLGKVKKQTIDDFISGMPDEMRVYLVNDSGVFSAKNLDNVIKKFNNNPVLRKYLNNIEETGKFDISERTPINEFEPFTLDDAENFKNLKFDELESFLMSGDSEISKLYRFSKPADFPDDPFAAKKLYAEFSKYYDIFLTKLKKVVLVQDKIGLDEVHGDINAWINYNLPQMNRSSLIEQMATIEKFVGKSNISGLVHNESAIKMFDYFNKIADFDSLSIDKELIDKMINILKYSGIKDTEFKNCINIISVLSSGKTDEFAKFLEKMSKNKDFNEIYVDLLDYIYKKAGIETTTTKKMLEGWDKEYLPFVLSALNQLEPDDADLLKGILKVASGEDYQKFLFDGNTPNAIRNRESREMFTSRGLDFNEFMNFDGKIDFKFVSKQLSLEPIKKSIIEDLTAMSNEPGIQNIFRDFLVKQNVAFDNNKLTINGNELNHSTMLQFIVSVNKFISDNQNTIANSKIADVKDHFVARKRAISKSISDGAAKGDMTIELWKRNPKHDLFQGHYCQCCVSLDGINKHSIIQTLGHTVDQIAELKDASGKTVGKVKMVFIENTQNHEPILLANGFEIIEPYNFDNSVRDAFVDYMKQYSKAVCGKEVPIYTGVTYQKINYDDLPDVEGNFLLLGKTPNDTYHLDSYSLTGENGSHPNNLDKPHDLKLKVMYVPE